MFPTYFDPIPHGLGEALVLTFDLSWLGAAAAAGALTVAALAARDVTRTRWRRATTRVASPSSACENFPRAA